MNALRFAVLLAWSVLTGGRLIHLALSVCLLAMGTHVALSFPWVGVPLALAGLACISHNVARSVENAADAL